MTPIPATYTFEKLDQVYAHRVDNGCPWHTLKCTLGKNEIRELLEMLRQLRKVQEERTSNPTSVRSQPGH